jgi:hypothetical protein
MVDQVGAMKVHHYSLLYGIRIENEEEKAWTITLC